MSISPTFPKLKSARPLLRRPLVYYPDSDGEPMAENDPQYFCITDTHFALNQYFKGKTQVYVSADLLVYYVEGDPTKSVAPDILVAFDVPQGYRRSYRIWEEGKAPDIIFEFASEGTWRADVGWKRGLYLGLGVREYFLFDPLAEHFDPLLQGFRMTGDSAEPMSPLAAERGQLGLKSEAMGLELWARPNNDPDMPYVLRLYDPANHTWLRTPDETEVARQTAEAEIARLKAELAQLRGGQPG